MIHPLQHVKSGDQFIEPKWTAEKKEWNPMHWSDKRFQYERIVCAIKFQMKPISIDVFKLQLLLNKNA